MRVMLPVIVNANIRAKRQLDARPQWVCAEVPCEIEELASVDCPLVMEWHTNTIGASGNARNVGSIRDVSGRLFAPCVFAAWVARPERTPAMALLGENRERHYSDLKHLYSRMRSPAEPWRRLRESEVELYGLYFGGFGAADGTRFVDEKNVMDWIDGEDVLERAAHRVGSWIAESTVIIDGNIWVEIDKPRFQPVVPLSVVDTVVSIQFRPDNHRIVRERWSTLRSEIDLPSFSVLRQQDLVEFAADVFGRKVVPLDETGIVIHDPAAVDFDDDLQHLRIVVDEVVEKDFPNLVDAPSSDIEKWVALRDTINKIMRSDVVTRDDALRLQSLAEEYQEVCRDVRLRNGLGAALRRWDNRPLEIGGVSDGHSLSM